MTKLRQVCAVAALAATASGGALADSSASIGIMSDYIFRGVYTSDASAFASIDLNADNGFYFGAWGADVQAGLEYDIYLGYAARRDEKFNWSLGFTGYYATDEAFDTSEEANFGINFGIMSIDIALGNYKTPVSAIVTGMDIDQTYTYVGAKWEPETGPYYFIGRTDYHLINLPDAGYIPGTGSDGYWLEIGKSFEIMDGLEFSIAALYTPDAQNPEDAVWSVGPLDGFTGRSVYLSGTDPYAEYAMVMTITKTIGGLGN